MLLSITTTHQPATDLGYLLYKHPERVQAFELPFGRAHVFYPQASEDLCTAVLLVSVDPVGLVRRRGGSDVMGLDQYVNDRPYVASSLLTVALATVFRNAMQGECKERSELAQTAIPLEAMVPAVPGTDELIRRLFEPLGYDVEVERSALDASFPEWGDARCAKLTLRATCRLADLLTHLYVLLPVLDNAKHYWVGDEEVQKLLRRGEGWLPTHPARGLITKRYLRHQRSLAAPALERLLEGVEPEAVDPEAADATNDPATGDDTDEPKADKKDPLNTQRHGAVVAALKACGARRVIDLGCAEGRLLRLLLDDRQFEEIVGVDVSSVALSRAEKRLEWVAPMKRQRVKLLQGSLAYRDKRLAGFDAAAVVEVIEHLEPHRLAAFERVLFGHARPRTVVLTTPNREYNAVFGMPADLLRHPDHRFEWSRDEFRQWAEATAGTHDYSLAIEPVGPAHDEHGAPTQMAVFTRNSD